MRIVMITPVFAPYRAGMARVAREYADAAYGVGHRVTVVTPEYPSVEHIDFDYDVQYVKPILHFGNAAWIGNIEVEGEIDIIHVHAPFIGGIGAARRLKQRYPNARVVVTYHMDLVSDGWKCPFFWLWNKFALPVLTQLADVIHVTSLDYFKNSVFFRYVGETRIVEIPLGIDMSKFFALEHEHGFSVLLVASLDSSHMFKGVKRAVRAISEVSEAHLVIVGGGDMKAIYEEFADELGCADRVRFLGSVTDEVLASCYSDADITILPSTASSEAFGLVLLESQASGTPVIASNLPGVRTVFDEGITGFQISCDGSQTLIDALRLWYDLDDSKKTSMRKACRQWAQRFDNAQLLKRLLDVYQKM